MNVHDMDDRGDRWQAAVMVEVSKEIIVRRANEYVVGVNLV